MKNLCRKITLSGKRCKKYKENNCDGCYLHKTLPDCSICYETIHQPYTLSCKHTFCSRCISKWIYLKEKDTCPLCRSFTTIEEELFTFKYCENNSLISLFIINIYSISDPDIKNYLQQLKPDINDHYYDFTNWNIIINSLRLNQEIHEKFLNINSYTDTYYIEFDSERSVKDVDGKSYIYNYKFNFI